MEILIQLDDRQIALRDCVVDCLLGDRSDRRKIVIDGQAATQFWKVGNQRHGDEIMIAISPRHRSTGDLGDIGIELIGSEIDLEDVLLHIDNELIQLV